MNQVTPDDQLVVVRIKRKSCLVPMWQFIQGTVVRTDPCEGIVTLRAVAYYNTDDAEFKPDRLIRLTKPRNTQVLRPQFF